MPPRRRHCTIWRRFAVPALAAALAGAVPGGASARTGAAYANPVLDSDFPDPALLRAPDGFIYAYATQGQGDGRSYNIQIARSRDLIHWERLGDALPDKPRWAASTQDFWAPHPVTHAGRYYLYFSAKPDAALSDPHQGLCLAVAVADRPEGPFRDSGRPLRCGEGFVDIDPMALDDPATGKALLYWGSGFQPIKVQPLAPDRVSFAPGSQAVPLVGPALSTDPRDYQRLVEGAWVIRRGGWYYLFFSGDNCCGPDAHYAVMVMRSRSATGPFRGPGGAESRGKMILAARGRWRAPGHNAVIRDDRGQDWIVYHAIDTRRPGVPINTRRVMLIDRLVWRNGWPGVAGGGPSDRPRAAPVFRAPRPDPR